jgi:hypothetical protein
MLELPTPLPSIVLEIANVRAIILYKKDHDDTDQKISNVESEELGESSLSCDIEGNNLDHWQEVLHPDQTRCDKTI